MNRRFWTRTRLGKAAHLLAILLVVQTLLPVAVHASLAGTGGRYVLMCTGQGFMELWVDDAPASSGDRDGEVVERVCPACSGHPILATLPALSGTAQPPLQQLVSWRRLDVPCVACSDGLRAAIRAPPVLTSS